MQISLAMSRVSYVTRRRWQRRHARQGRRRRRATHTREDPETEVVAEAAEAEVLRVPPRIHEPCNQGSVVAAAWEYP